jgi:hypothetical protein
MLKILAELPKEIPATGMLVSFNRKSTEKNPVPDELKTRYVIVAATPFSITAEPTTAQEAFSAAVQEAFESAATSIFQDYCTQNLKDGKYPEEMPEEMLTFSAIVEKMQASISQERLNQEMIFAFYDGSETKKEAAERWKETPKKMEVFRVKLGSLASNNPGISADLATKMIGYMSEKDVANPVCRAIVKKLEVLTKKKVDADEL